MIESDVRHVNIGDEIRQEVILRLPIKLLSDEEAAKERQDAIDDEPPDDGVYQPFADLKDID